ncbi:hypothetical protein ACFPA8_05310 [Streptomyces ovatisporus]|uniref:ARB-07466-like C-terminal domain-containing protein n=1 Tax=Streptomyces ovatisporus TaxID=1128682 RepID=A0ABV9A3P0_9ACTN
MSRSDTRPTKPHAKKLRIAAAFAVLFSIAGYVAAQYVTSATGPARCTVSTAGAESKDYELRPEQAANAATITAVGSQRRLPERAVTIALATAMQESSLRNISHGDRDSLGLFQQRPSQGWGTQKQITDPVYSSGKFYDRLVRIPGYSRLPLTVAAQRVQRSGYPQAYAKHEANASLLTAALTGRRAAAFNCTTGPAGGDGKAGSPAQVRERLMREFGKDVLAGSEKPVPAAAAEGVGLRESDGGDARESAGGYSRTQAAARLSADGKEPEVRIPARADERGWELAHWAVAHASELHIAQVSFGDRVWDASSSEQGWRTREGSDSGTGSKQTSVRMRLATAD